MIAFQRRRRVPRIGSVIYEIEMKMKILRIRLRDCVSIYSLKSLPVLFYALKANAGLWRFGPNTGRQ